MEAIKRDFGSFESFKEWFNTATVAVQGSGWGWLVSCYTGLMLPGLTGERLWCYKGMFLQHSIVRWWLSCLQTDITFPAFSNKFWFLLSVWDGVRILYNLFLLQTHLNKFPSLITPLESWETVFGSLSLLIWMFHQFFLFPLSSIKACWSLPPMDSILVKKRKKLSNIVQVWSSHVNTLRWCHWVKFLFKVLRDSALVPSLFPPLSLILYLMRNLPVFRHFIYLVFFSFFF